MLLQKYQKNPQNRLNHHHIIQKEKIQTKETIKCLHKMFPFIPMLFALLLFKEFSQYLPSIKQNKKSILCKEQIKFSPVFINLLIHLEKRFMGFCSSKEKKTKTDLWVATLNYSSIVKSPFQFYQLKNGKGNQEDQLSRINQKFQEIAFNYWSGFSARKESQELKKWPMGKIDKIYQNRYSPLYDQHCGIDYYKGLFESEMQFRQTWMIRFKKTLYDKKLIKTQSYSENISEKIEQFLIQFDFQERNKNYFNGKGLLLEGNIELNFEKKEIYFAIKFDLACFHAILAHLFDENKISDSLIYALNKKKDETNQKKYTNFMAQFFSKRYTKNSQKINETIKMLEKCDLDVLFLQEVDKKIINAIQKKLPHYRISRSDHYTEVILINQRSFPQLEKTGLILQNLRFYKNQNQISTRKDLKNFDCFDKNDWKQLNINQKTFAQIAGRYIFVCGHLSSRKDDNKQQVKQMIEILTKLKKTYKSFDIICGFDVNEQLTSLQKNDLRNKGYFFYPDSQITSFKKRTFLQPQIFKAEILEQKCKHYLLSTVEISSPKVLCIDEAQTYIKSVENIRPQANQKKGSTKYNEEKKKKNQLLPTSSHPYDNYMVLGKIKRNEEKAHSHLQRKKSMDNFDWSRPMNIQESVFAYASALERRY